jgi:hypothetical protein
MNAKQDCLELKKRRKWIKRQKFEVPFFSRGPIKDKAFFCKLCGVDTFEIGEYYMIQEKVWCSFQLNEHSVRIYEYPNTKEKVKGVAYNNKGMLCIGCLENKIKRTLYYKDFIDYPINNHIDLNDKSTRIQSRMMAKESKKL